MCDAAPAGASFLSDVSVEVDSPAGTLRVPTQVLDVPDIPGAFMVEIPLYGDLDPQNIQALRLQGRLMDFEVASPEITDHRDLQFSVAREPFSQFRAGGK